MSSGLGVTDNMYAGFRAPLYDTFIQRVREYYRTAYGEDSRQYRECYVKGKLHFEPHVAERVFTDLVKAESRITVLTGYDPVSAERSGRRICAVTLRSREGGSPIRIEAEAFVDASYEGDLAAAAGAQLRTGREGRNEYDEPHAGKLFAFPGNAPVSSEAVAGLLDLETLPGGGRRLYADPAGEGDEAFQAYNFRVTLTCDPHNRIYPQKPEGYDRSLYLGLAEKPEAHTEATFVLRSHLMLSDGSWSLKSHIPNDKVTWNDPLLLGAQLDYPSADWSGREEIARRHADFALGMLYFLQHDEAVRPEVRQEALRWGLPRDEFADNGHFPYEILVREGRRLVGRHIFTEHDGKLVPGLGRTPIHADSVGIADWPISSHDCTADRRPGSLNDGVLNLSELTRPSQIPYRVLLPGNVDNLLVTVCLSCTHMGWGTLRLEPVFIQLGESAAYAVVLAARQGKSPGELDADQLVRKLAEHQVLVSYFREFEEGPMRRDWSAAVQYFATKGFFPDYDAGAEQELDRRTAAIWAEAFARLTEGRLDPMDTARRLAAERERSGESEPVGAEAFRRLVERELAVQGLPSPLRSLEAAREDGLLRGDACAWLYAIAEGGLRLRS